MKKLISLFLLTAIVFSLAGCVKPENEPKPYEGPAVTSLALENVSYMDGGGRTIYNIDFAENKATCRNVNSWNNIDETTVIATFDDSAEKSFIDGIYNAGLFDIKDYYSIQADDGGGWGLTISFADGTEKKSAGSNAAPEVVFAACSQHAVDLMGVAIFGYLGYKEPPPRVWVSLEYTCEDQTFTYSNMTLERVDYRWNSEKYDDNVLNGYVAAVRQSGTNITDRGTYKAVIDTSLYGERERFLFCEIWSCNNDIKQSDMRLEKITPWFDSIEMPVQVDRIYIVKLRFLDGDFIEYVFGTSKPEKMHSGASYCLNKDQENEYKLTLRYDGDFNLRTPDDVDKNLKGSYSTENIDGVDRIVLRPNTGGTIVFDYYGATLILNRSLSTKVVSDLKFGDGDVLFTDDGWDKTE